MSVVAISISMLFVVLMVGIVVLALLKKGDVRAAFRMPWFAFALEAKDRRAAPQKKLALPNREIQSPKLRR